MESVTFLGSVGASCVTSNSPDNNSSLLLPHNSHLQLPLLPANTRRSAGLYSIDPMAPLAGVGKKAINAVNTVRTIHTTYITGRTHDTHTSKHSHRFLSCRARLVPRCLPPRRRVVPPLPPLLLHPHLHLNLRVLTYGATLNPISPLMHMSV